ncbi:MAG TPA: peptidoglycan DD-metalloendopeptidase family protein [Gemmatimonadaceae bacterium]|nr:peptidoglycan DD-metalloendopeptidase family protein [Gemmatimonadaceae bacterium]
MIAAGSFARRGAALAAVFAVAIAATTMLPARASAQRTADSTEARLRAERDRLDQLRREREELQRRMTQLQSTVHDLSEEVTNLDRQAATTERLVRSLDDQLGTISTEVRSTTADLVRTEDELVAQQAILRRRLVDIYKRGPLFSVQVLLSAESFGDLVSRYKYLHLLAQRDRALVAGVRRLRDRIGQQRSSLVRFQQQIRVNLDEKADEERRLRALREQRERALGQTRRRAQQTAARLEQVARDEQRLTNVIAALEAARRRGPAADSRSTLRTSDFGNLDWPVDGTILYNFGRVVNPNNTTTRWNGIGIAAAEGTPVHAVAAGRVVVAEPFGTYGLTVIIQHGGGDYSVYGSLSRLSVEKNAIVSKGEVIGYVGSADPDLPPHLHFEMRPQGRAVDPLDWLRSAAP